MYIFLLRTYYFYWISNKIGNDVIYTLEPAIVFCCGHRVSDSSQIAQYIFKDIDICKGLSVCIIFAIKDKPKTFKKNIQLISSQFYIRMCHIKTKQFTKRSSKLNWDWIYTVPILLTNGSLFISSLNRCH